MDPKSRDIVVHTLRNGAAAGALSTAVLLLLGRIQTGHAAAPINAVSHWFWGPRAYRDGHPRWRYTLPGALTHQGASIFWAAVYEVAFDARMRGRPLPALAAGSAIAGLACFVDYQLVPRRLTPGFEHRLTRGALALVYLSFGLGLALTDVLANRRPGGRRRSSRQTAQ